MRVTFPFLLSLLCIQLAAAAPVIREDGAIYLDDHLAKAIRLTALGTSAIFYESDLGRYLGTIPKGQAVELQAIKGDACRVLGRAQQGGVVGWMRRSSLSPLAPDFVQKLEESAKRAALVASFIERHEVAVNMTPDEVFKSLGKPQKKSSRTDQSGRSEIWEYVTYERVPQQVTSLDQYGRPIVSYIYVKQPVGQQAVVFSGGVVSAIDQSEGTLSRGTRVSILTPPIELY